MPSALRPSFARLSTRPIPLSSVPRLLLRLPPKPASVPSTKNGASPTVDRLLATLSQRAGRRASRSTPDARGLGSLRDVGLGGENVDLVDAATPTPVETALESASGRGLGAGLLPPNLRIEEFVPRRNEYSGVKSSHRELLQKLRREA